MIFLKGNSEMIFVYFSDVLVVNVLEWNTFESVACF